MYFLVLGEAYLHVSVVCAPFHADVLVLLYLLVMSCLEYQRLVLSGLQCKAVSAIGVGNRGYQFTLVQVVLFVHILAIGGLGAVDFDTGKRRFLK